MNRKFSFILLMMLLLCCGNSFPQGKKTPEVIKKETKAQEEKEKFRSSKIKSITYFLNGSKVGVSRMDSTGNIINDIFYKCDILNGEIVYSFDKKNNLIKKEFTDKNGKFFEGSYFEYASDGKVLTSILKFSDSLKNYKAVSGYDKYGSLLSSKTYDYRDSLFSEEKNEYDENNYQVSSCFFDNYKLLYYVKRIYSENGYLTDEHKEEYIGDDTFKTHTKLIYNEKNNLIEKSAETENKTDTYRETFKYDGNDNITEYCSFNSEGKPEMENEYRYDRNGNLTEVIYYFGNGEIDRTESNKYNGENKLTETIITNNKNETEAIVFREYDRKGNLKSVNNRKGDFNENFEYVYEYY